MKISNELKVALTILAAIVVGFLGYRVMSDLPVFRQSTTVYTHFSKAEGLTAGNNMYINGVKVGAVQNIRLEGDSVHVTLNFDLGIEIPENSVAYLESTGLLDEKTVVIERGDSQDLLEYGDTIPGVYRGGIMETVRTEGQQISEDVSASFGQLNQLLEELNKMVDKEARGHVDQTLGNLEATTGEIAALLEGKRSELESSISHAQQILATVDTVSMRNSERVDSLLIGMNRSMQELELLSRELNQTNNQLNQILTKINKGKGSLGKMVNDTSLYNNLESLTGEMNQLIKNINEDPGEYLKHMRLIEVF